MASQFISYALGHPREIGVSACGNSRERMVSDGCLKIIIMIGG